ncbi:putative DNA repair protein YkoV [compost metagenome]
MARAIWKGAISFGLVHIPVALVSASESRGVDFDWLDKRSMDPVGYKRVNKVTGKEVTKDHIVKGVEYGQGHYVVLSEEEIRAAHPRSTQTIEIFAFVDSAQIPLQNIDTPYYLSPDKRGGKVYALLREALVATGKVALARVVLRTRQHLAALMPLESALALVMLRWPEEVRDLDILDLGSEVTKPSLAKGELDMAKRLIEDMSTDWTPADYEDSFTAQVMELVERKAKAGKIERVESAVAEEERRGADIIDLTELLKRSLGGKAAAPARKAAAAKPAKKAARTARK